jgi:hypothetical protein
MVAAATVHAQTTKWKTFIFAEDKSAANDSVEYNLLKICLKQKGLPDQFVQFYENTALKKRTTIIICDFGNTRPVVL